MNTSVIVVPGQAYDGEAVGLFIAFFGQIQKFSSSQAGKQAHSQHNLDQGGILLSPCLTQHEKSSAETRRGKQNTAAGP